MPLKNLPCFEDRHHWHWLDPIINSKSHVNLVLLSHLLQNLTSFENQLRCRLGVICEKLVKLSKAWNCQRSVWWKKIVFLNLLNNFHFSYQNKNAWVKKNPSKHIEHFYTHYDLTNFSAFTYEYLTDSWMPETETAIQAKKKAT